MLSRYNFNSSQIRIIEKDNQPLFIAKDICQILGIKNSRDALSRLDDDEKDSVGLTDSIGRARQTPAVNESGLYALIMQSRKKNAKQFRKWVTGEVLPAIRRNGSYSVADQVPKDFAAALQLAADQQKQIQEKDRALLAANTHREELINQAEKDAPRVAFAKRVSVSSELVDVESFAKAIGLKNYGRNNMFKYLREAGYINYKNMPYQQYINIGLFKVVEKESKRDGRLYFQTLLTGKGQLKIAAELLPDHEITVSGLYQPDFNLRGA